jgi:CheY-like chemotaxis protein
MTNWNILLVEDDMDGQEVISRMLRHQQISVDVVRSGEEALKLLADNVYDGAIIDLNLPGMDGWTLLRNIRQNPRSATVPCVAVTAYHSPELAVKAMEYGFTTYFPKPIEALTFVKEIQRLMAG